MERRAGPVLTSHTGSLPRSSELVALLHRKDRGALSEEELPRSEATITEAVRDIVSRQIEIGLDVVNDGEQGKISYAVYVKDRLSGFGGEGKRSVPADIRDFPSFMDRYIGRPPSVRPSTPACIGPVAYKGIESTKRDLDNLTAALRSVGKSPADAFVTAASPGVISYFLVNQYYGSDEEYLAALATAMRVEYDLIHAAGFALQVDCPDLAAGWHSQFADLDLKGFRREAATHVEALNHALADVPADRLRMHLCWGNYEGPHHRDVPLRDIVDIVLRAKPATLSFEAANPRHAHEWRVWEEVALPEGKTLMPGVIDTTTNYVEHPELVAERLLRFARIVGPGRVIGATDCGLATFAGMNVVDPEIAWAKLGSLVEGAKLASAEWAGASSDVALAPRTRGANEIRV